MVHQPTTDVLLKAIKFTTKSIAIIMINGLIYGLIYSRYTAKLTKSTSTNVFIEILIQIMQITAVLWFIL